ncbi:RCC1/BLIP-II protein [Peniophora sp. CONT]|nr:RCC1/BLIP-II protein [Peniophora sp. CONT]
MSSAMAETLAFADSAMVRIDDLVQEGRTDELRALYQTTTLEYDRVVKVGQGLYEQGRFEERRADLRRRLVEVRENLELLIMEMTFTNREVLRLRLEAHQLEHVPSCDTSASLPWRTTMKVVGGIEEEIRIFEKEMRGLNEAAQTAVESLLDVFDKLLEASDCMELTEDFTAPLVADGEDIPIRAVAELGTGDCEDVHIFRQSLFHWDGKDRHELPSITRCVERIVGGANHTLLLTSTTDGEHELWCSGDNGKGQLGGTPSCEDTAVFRRMHVEHPDLSGWRVKNVAAAWETSYIVFSDGSRDAVLAMGSNERSMLGHQGSDGVHLVDLSALSSGEDIIVQDIVAGPMHVVALIQMPSKDCTLAVGWGTARHGQLGEPTQKVRDRPRLISALPENNPITSVALGNQHTVLGHTDGRVTALGSSRVGQLAGLASQSDISSVHCTWNGTYIIPASDKSLVLSTGKNNKGQLGRATEDSLAPSLSPVMFPPAFARKTITQMTCGSEHVVLLTGDDEVWGWGWNEHGNIGSGDMDDVPLPTPLWTSDGGKTARGVWAGCGTTFIVVEQC